jgi:hypothetical protein
MFAKQKTVYQERYSKLNKVQSGRVLRAIARRQKTARRKLPVTVRSTTKGLRRYFPPIFVDVAQEKTRMTIYLQIAKL